MFIFNKDLLEQIMISVNNTKSKKNTFQWDHRVLYIVQVNMVICSIENSTYIQKQYYINIIVITIKSWVTWTSAVIMI